MRRRDFIKAIAGSSVAWPLTARAQQKTMPVIGLLGGNPIGNHDFDAIQNGLKEAGFVEGRNVTIDSRSADGHYERLPGLASDIVRRQVAVIVAILGTASLVAAKAATTDIPIVFVIGSDQCWADSLPA
jgi:putative tryptophan/tyrosine transport system substrate-binding protein